MQPAEPAPPGSTLAVRALPAGSGPAAIVAALLCVGESTLGGVEDDAVAAALCRTCSALGAVIVRNGLTLRISGVGIGGLAAAAETLALPGAALWPLAGALSGHGLVATITTDIGADALAGLAQALEKPGAMLREGPSCTWLLTGAGDALPFSVGPCSPDVATAALFAGLCAPGTTTVTVDAPEPLAAEAVLTAFGAVVDDSSEGSRRRIVLTGLPELSPCHLVLPPAGRSAA